MDRRGDSAPRGGIQHAMEKGNSFIADGHHRYETSLRFKKEMEEKGLVKTGSEPYGNGYLQVLAC
jgi:uncharacterized protein (DUF1015 family)